MKVAIALGRGTEEWEEAAAFLLEAERLGAHIAWSAETWGHDAATPIAFMAARTSRIRLGTGIIQVGARTPANIAMVAMTLASMSGDRFTLGLGASGPQVMEGWHGVPFKGAVQRLRETVEIVRIISRGERLSYQGKYYTLPLPGGEGKALKTAAQPRDFPIYLATLSPRSLRMTGEVADGWLGTSFIPEQARVFTDHIAAGAETAGRSLADIELQVAAGVVEFGDDLGRLVEPRKAGLAFSLGAMGSAQHNFYNDAYKRAGYEDVARGVQAAWLDGRREEARAMVPAEMVLKTNLIGTREMVKDRIRAHRDAGVTTINVNPAGETLSERVDNLGRLMELVKDVEAEGRQA